MLALVTMLTFFIAVRKFLFLIFGRSTTLIGLFVGRDGIPVSRPDSQSREPGFKSHCGRFEPLASLITPRCHGSLRCINVYLAIQTVVDM